MKKVFSFATGLFLLTVLLSTSSCKKEDVTVLQGLEEYSACLPANVNYGTTPFTYTITQSQIQAAFASAGVSFDKARVKALKLNKIRAQVVTTAATFNQIDGFEVYAKPTGASGDGTQIAYVASIGDNLTAVDMLLNGSDIKDLLNETSITFTLKVTTKPGGNSDICIKLTDGVLAYTVSAE
jgi:hypothetical protein